MYAAEAIIFFGILAWVAWRIGDPKFALVAAAFCGIGALLYTIGNGFRDEAPYAWGVTVGLVAAWYALEKRAKRRFTRK